MCSRSRLAGSRCQASARPRHVVLPACTLGVLGAGWYARMVRSAMIEVLNQDYVRTARAKGISERRVILRHALPNALLPIIAMIGIDIGQFMSGVVVVEAVYGWPGIGQLVWQAIQQVDMPIIMGVTLVSAFAIVTGQSHRRPRRAAHRSAHPRPLTRWRKGHEHAEDLVEADRPGGHASPCPRFPRSPQAAPSSSPIRTTSPPSIPPSAMTGRTGR